MSKRNNNNGWWLLFLIVAIVILLYVLPKLFKEDIKEEGEDLENLKSLKQKSEIIKKHKERYKFIDNYLKEQADRWYKIIFRILILLVILFDVLIFILIPNIELLEIIGLNSVVVFTLVLIEGFVYTEIKRSPQERIKELLQDQIESRIFRKDREYYLKKILEYKEFEKENDSQIKNLQKKISSKKDSNQKK